MEQIYKEELMEIYKNPPNRGKITNPTTTVVTANPLCGDSITLQLKIKNNKIRDAKFDGNLCAVSVISAAKVTEDIKEMTLEDAKKITKAYLLKSLDLNLSTSRIQCATLILKALQNAVETYETNK